MDNQTNTSSSNDTQPVVSANQTANVPSQRSSKGRLVLFGLLALFVVGAASAGAYMLGAKNNQPAQPQASPTPSQPTITPDPISEWKTYANKKYGYSFKYPLDSTFPKLEDNYAHPDYLGSTVVDFPVESFKTKPFVNVSVWDDINMSLANVQQFKNYCNKLLSRLPEREIANPICSSDSNYESVTLNDYKAYKIRGGQDNTLIERYFIPFNSYVYEIRIPVSVLYDEKNSYKIEEVSRAILSTFKFTQ